ncbi:MAG: alanine racemase, partial [Planctomycetota bacterium]|nr:alanine racemase [Planctomycetota bacterium]
VMTQDQLVRFDEFLATHREDFDEQCVLHAANSFATLRKSHCHQHMVRVGLALLGHGPGWMRGGWHQTQATCLEPIIRWTSHLAKIRTIEPGTSVGYGATWIAKRRTVLGVVAVGYADGYPMALGGSDRNPKSACIGVLDQHDDTTVLGYASIVGRVNMDQIIIDLTDLVASHGDIVGIGSKIELLSRETEFPGEESPNHLATLAKVANTVPHELLCRLNPRIPRVYHDQALPQQTVEPKPRIISKV